LIDDYHDIHQVRNPINENLLNVDTDLLSWVLRIDHMSSLRVSYIEKKSTWFCVSNNTNLNEETLINHLTVHSYDPDLQEAHPEKKRMRYTKLINFIPQELKSLDEYLQAITPFIESPVINDYLTYNIIPVPADYPGQYFIRKAITLQRRFGDSINISKKILHLVPLLGPLHVSLNTRETTVKIYHSFFNILFKEIFQRKKELPMKPQPWMINLILYLTNSGWVLIRTKVLEKFKQKKNMEYQIFLDLLDNIIPATLDIYAILFREGHFEEYVETIFRLWTIMMRFERKNYDKIMLAFLSDVYYWQSIEHPLHNALQDHLTEFNEYFIENFHSLIRRRTTGKNFNVEGLQRDAIAIDHNRHNSEFIRPFLSLNKYPYKKKDVDIMTKKVALFLLDFFKRILLNSNTNSLPILKGKKKQTHVLHASNISITYKALPSGYHTKNPPNHEKSCDFENCNLQNENQNNFHVFICGHSYHLECFEKMDFKCQYCLQYYIEGIQNLGNSYNERLENTENCSIFDDDDIEGNENENENEIYDPSLDSINEPIRADKNLDQKLRMNGIVYVLTKCFLFFHFIYIIILLFDQPIKLQFLYHDKQIN